MFVNDKIRYNNYMNTLNYAKIGNKIKTLRNKASLTQEQLAEKCNISTSYLGHIERGSRRLSLETAVRLAEVLGVGTDELILANKTPESSIFPHINAVLGTKPKQKQYEFLKIVKLLSEHIDEL